MFFSNWFKLKPLPETDLEREYMLLHNVLSALRDSGMSTSRVGSEVKGHIPIYEYNLTTSFLPFSTLGAVLNKAEIVNPQTYNLMGLQKIEVVEEDVQCVKYKWVELSKAIDTLQAAKEIVKETEGTGMFGTTKKTIKLTDDGMYSFNTRKYETLYVLERNRREAHKSTMITQRLTRLFTGIVTTSTVATLFLTVFDKCHKDNTPTQVMIMPASTTTKKPSPSNNYKNSPTKSLATDSIPHKK